MADELNDRIYMIGGTSTPQSRRKLCRYYEVSLNSWGDCGTLDEKTYVRMNTLFDDAKFTTILSGLCSSDSGG